ncbi:MAG: hypothetical protein K2M42_08585 [Oscillospiraceae bacterium]|nr:hypothetical protein [Oscillospiraceae bacterium]
MSTKDPQGRKWLITINNPTKKGWNHDKIKVELSKLKSIIYYCLGDERGEIYHTHIFFMADTPIRFSTIKKRFPEAHIDKAYGTAADNKNYVEKSGKWSDTDKASTKVENTFEESGELPEELGQGYRSDIAEIYRQIDDGMSNAEIMAANPDAAMHIGKMDKIRQDILEARYRDQWRELDVTYIFGPTATGKTRGVMEAHGYGSVYRVTDYKHPFDRYAQEPILCLDEFRSSLPISDMLDYLDGYPLALPARYANRQACYETVYILSNIDLPAQYPAVQATEPETWKAFLRRIHHVIEYRTHDERIDHGSATEYITSKHEPGWIKEAEGAEQEELF